MVASRIDGLPSNPVPITDAHLVFIRQIGFEVLNSPDVLALTRYAPVELYIKHLRDLIWFVITLPSDVREISQKIFAAKRQFHHLGRIGSDQHARLHEVYPLVK